MEIKKLFINHPRGRSRTTTTTTTSVSAYPSEVYLYSEDTSLGWNYIEAASGAFDDNVAVCSDSTTVDQQTSEIRFLNLNYTHTGTPSALSVVIKKKALVDFVDTSLYLVYDSETIGSNKASETAWTEDYTEVTYNMWDESLTASILESPTFGISFVGTCGEIASGDIAFIDGVRFDISETS